MSPPGCVDPSHTNHYHLDPAGQLTVARLVTAVAYNSPDISYSPLLYPVTAILRHYLDEHHCYEMVRDYHLINLLAGNQLYDS